MQKTRCHSHGVSAKQLVALQYILQDLDKDSSDNNILRIEITQAGRQGLQPALQVLNPCECVSGCLNKASTAVSGPCQDFIGLQSSLPPGNATDAQLQAVLNKSTPPSQR